MYDMRVQCGREEQTGVYVYQRRGVDDNPSPWPFST